jgi:ribosomal protein S18 acetylase RimI-like enzyme
MPIDLFPITAPEALRLLPEVADVYGAAFAAPPYSRTDADVANFAATFRRHGQRREFRMLGARAPGGPLLGFSYGYTAEPNQWWYDVVARALSREARAYWLRDAFELVELAVDPAAQGQGLGGRLHDDLLRGLPHHTAVLSTAQAETAGQRLYRKRGWEVLLPHFVFPGGSMPFLIMGLDLSRRPAP